ncbi:hypothetical protein [Sutcliffiella rhizosphaerae]|uniref:Uncharacterized protein n=1 Tax=Sutcliffiella rhizosphaerae TaxID=2880967 RepID=A0ABN8AC92_9BACI|nr:hypothetical protein [Sutcliffiella rhizosphaerae]CAG9621836.1 hypothetical protein BACCIP111883_02627 [Sutcliffiella rhizosphaerae]
MADIYLIIILSKVLFYIYWLGTLGEYSECIAIICNENYDYFVFNENKSNITKFNNITVEGPSFGNVLDEFSGIELEELELLILKVKE